ncbi:MAG: ATP-binding protein [Pseudomonadota bacterium]|nr:ATP-binding protein [Pseudomonadota bacterium]
MFSRLKRWIGGPGRATAEDLASARLRAALDFIPEGIAFYDADDRIVIWNARYAELNDEGGGWLIKGASFRDLLQAGIDNGVYPEADGREAEWLEARLALRRSGSCALEQENKGHWLRIVERRTADGGVVSICEDITDLKQREAMLRMMFENSPVPMWVMSHETGRLVDVNAAAVAHYGYTREEFIGKPLLEMYAPEEREHLLRHIQSHGDAAYRGERSWRQLKADGSEVWTKPYVQAIRVGDGPGAMAAQFDMTASRLAEMAMAAARDQAEAANRAKSEFLANMSHEIRTPLNGVLGLVGVLANTELSAGQAEMVRVIQGSAQSLERLLRDVLDFARVESGRVEIENEPFHLGETLRATVALFGAKAQEKGVELRVEIAPAVDLEIEADEGRIKQIVSNLLSNAVKFTAEGSVTLKARPEESESGDRLVVSVEDTGVGFDPASKDRLFSRFEQEDGSVTRRFGGSGLGLAISRQLAELMGGGLEASSQPGKGATFTLELPLRPVEQDESNRLGEGRRLRILLADDHPTNQKVVELMLHAVEAELTCVSDGEAAVAAALSGAYDLVLMDIQMPVLDGLSAIARIREHERATGAARTPIYTLSGNAAGRHQRAAIAAGADRHLTKPISATVLITALAELSEARAAQAAA